MDTIQTYVALRARFDSITAADDSVFFLAAPKPELLKIGAVEERGGLPLTFGFGKTLVPLASSRKKAFQPLLKSRDTVIALPRADCCYALVSAHPLVLLRADRCKGTRRGGTLRSGSPKEFWGTSRDLILEER